MTARTIGATGGAVAIAAALAWLHSTIYAELVRAGQAGPQASLAWRLDLVHLAEIAGLVGIVILGLWARSLAVGAAFVAAGACLSFLQAITLTFAVGRSGAQPVLPEPIASAIWQLWNSPASPALIDAGGALLATGVALLAWAGLERRRPG